MDQFVYNPAQSIKASLGETQAGVGNIFAQIAAQKQQDYKLAENVFQNIGALTENLGKYGQKEIVDSTKNLIGEASKSILKNGKLDYDTIGKIRSQVQDIKNRKSALDTAANAYKEKLQLVLATKDEYGSLSNTLRDLEAPLLNPGNKSADDIVNQMDTAIQNNVDLNRLTTKLFSQITPISNLKQTYETKDGARRLAEGKTIAGFKYDPLTKTFKEPDPIVVNNPDGTTSTKDFYDVVTEQMQQVDPGALSLLRTRLGGNAALSTDKDIVKAFYEPYKKLQNATQDVELESANKRKLEDLTIAQKAFDVNTQQKEFNMKMKLMQAQINKANERDGGGISQQSLMDAANKAIYKESYTDNSQTANVDLVSGKVTPKKIDFSGVNLGKQLKVNIGENRAIATDILKDDKTGGLYAKVLLDNNGNYLLDENKLAGAKIGYKKIDNPKQFIQGLDQTIRYGGYDKKDEPFIRAQVSTLLGARASAPEKQASDQGQVKDAKGKVYKFLN